MMQRHEVQAGDSAGRRVAIVQSNYMPWKGYFDLIAWVDAFVFLDDVQYTHRDWRNRNRIKTADGLKWLSVPVVHDRSSRICEVTIATDQGNWTRKHLGTIEHAYKQAPFAAAVLPWLSGLYDELAACTHLSDANSVSVRSICQRLGIGTRITTSTDYFTLEQLGGFDPTTRLLELCKAAGATSYLSGPAARAYMDTSIFDNAGIAVEWMDYDGYPEYQQLHGPFEHGVSILDLLLMAGPEATSLMKYAPPAGSAGVANAAF
jgi:hypothetical protein